MKPQIPKRLGRVSALAPQTALCLCLCLHMYHAFALPQKRFSKLSTQLWPSWLLLPSMNAHCEPCACLFACDTHLPITSHSLQSISCLTNGNWGPEVVLKFIFSKPQRGRGGISLIHCDLDISKPSLVLFLVGKPFWDVFYDICS